MLRARRCPLEATALVLVASDRLERMNQRLCPEVAELLQPCPCFRHKFKLPCAAQGDLGGREVRTTQGVLAPSRELLYVAMETAWDSPFK